ncbi:Unknown protein [Striga hermonthica]|uniref:F-box domain-containing protein n=1 Tax=Striga hermonthica TaxID=68872 RepID=A0A9N7MM44_STRHE|nr:Unknown protein [Striga hermonthica]
MIMVLPSFSSFWRRLIHRFFLVQPDSPQHSPSPFDDLPDDAIRRIFSNLCTGDRVRLRLVCRSWRDTLTRSEFRTLPEPPWLIRPEPEPISTYFELMCPYEDRVYSCDLPCHLLSGDRLWSCRGSGAGWLLLACWDPAEMVLWDPLSGTTLALPSPSTLPFFDELDHDVCVIRLAQVAPVGPAATLAVAVVFTLTGLRDKLAMCLPDCQCWTVLPGPTDEHYADILLQNGKLQAVCPPPRAPGTGPSVAKRTDFVARLSSGCHVEVVTWELKYEAVLHQAAFDYDEYETIGCKVYERFHVAEHLVPGRDDEDELLLVSATLDMFSHNFGSGGGGLFGPQAYMCPQTRGFEVRRLSLKDDSLEKVDRTGDVCIFLGATGSTSMEKIEVPNYIHYATTDGKGKIWDEVEEEEEEEENGESDVDKLFVLHEHGTFNMEDGTIERHYLDISSLQAQGSCIGWFKPVLRT